jgi:hypothetical protein
LGKKAARNPATKSGKRRQKAAMNLSHFVALTCCLLSPFAASSDAHSGSDEANETIFRQTTSLSRNDVIEKEPPMGN